MGLALAARKNFRFRQALLLMNMLVCMAYLLWRLTAIPLTGWVPFGLGAALYLCELMGILEFLILQMLYTRKYRLRQRFLTEFKDGPPTVDVLICTYNEALPLLEKTILAALDLEYPKERIRVWVCDDGARDEVKTLCAAAGAGYFARGNNEGAKAGNINYALRHTSGELFAVLDADMVCTRRFLARTAGYFADRRTAFVQTPQVYYNRDVYQRNVRTQLPNEQDFFMRSIQEARAAFNAVLHVGTNALFRRSYVEEIGLFPTSSITEDMAVGMLLQRAGYTGVFINEALVFGLSASTYTDLAIQRDRWCRGNLQVMRQFRPLTGPGLSFYQRIAYFDSYLYWMMAFQKMAFLLFPLLFFFTGASAIDTSIPSLTAHFLPFFTGQMAVFHVLSPHTRSLRWAHYYEAASAPHTCMSILKEWVGLHVPFRVTNKQVKEHAHFQFRAAAPHLFFALVTIAAWGTGYWSMVNGALPLSAYLINMTWSIYNFAALAVSIRAAYHAAEKEPGGSVAVEGGHEVRGEARGRTIWLSIQRLSEEGMIMRTLTLETPEEGEHICVIMERDGESQQICGSVEAVNGRAFFFRYDGLTLQGKRAIIGMYVEHLRPFFDAGITQEYL